MLDQEKKELARLCLENPLFSNLFEVTINNIKDSICSLEPNNVDSFRIYRSQQIIIEQLYDTFKLLAEMSTDEKIKNNAIL